MDSKSSKNLTYGYVEVFERLEIGIGCYGKVYKAKCGQLPCVAKVFHSALFKFDPANEQSLSLKVEKDCRHLSSIKHPHLVTYLGFIRDAKSKKLLLLMEAMDENLTNYLDRTTSPLPISKQISFCYDIALALSYLHSIKCIHKNLSSSNVLLLAGRRAKVGDYGITSFANFGTIQVFPSVYMPPEIRREPSHYSCKTDTFSFGVLVVQIATKAPPEPAPVTELLDSTTGEACSDCEISDEDGMVGSTQEIHRRKRDIDKMNIDHPAMSLLLSCLNDKESLRPSANELCEFIETILPDENKDSDVSLPSPSMTIAPAATSAAAPPANNGVTEEIIIDNFKNKLGQLLQELSDRNEEIAERDSEIQLLDKLLKEKTEKLSKLEKQLSEKNETLGTLQRKKSTKDLSSSSTHKDSDSAGNDGKKAREEGKKGDMEQRRKPTRYVSQKSLGHLPLQWSPGQPAPRPVSLYMGSAVMDGTRAYISLVNQIYTYTTPTSKWIRLPECSQSYFSLAVVKGQVVVIGGIQGCQAEGGPVNTLKNLAPNKIWDEYLPPMPTKRAFAASITTSDHLVVAGGGETPNSDGLSVVEILLLEEMQWSTAVSLPTPARFPQLVMMDMSVYFFSADSNKVYSCPLEDILHNTATTLPTIDLTTVECVDSETTTTEVTHTRGKPAENIKWKKNGSLPFSGGTKILSEGGMLLGLGGHDSKYRPSKTIVSYNADCDSWRSVGLMATPRWGALAVCLPNRKIMVVGGNTSIQDIINTNEIASLIPDT